MREVKPDSSSTKRLLSEAASGDRGAFDDLLARPDELHRFIELRLDRRWRARLDPSDLVQDTQLQAFRKLDDYLRRRPIEPAEEPQPVSYHFFRFRRGPSKDGLYQSIALLQSDDIMSFGRLSARMQRRAVHLGRR
jgi:hypothetical protein